MKSIVVVALYKFVQLDDYRAMRAPLLEVCQRENIKGTILLAHEGINGTIAGNRAQIDRVVAYLQQDLRLQGISYKESYTAAAPFLRLKIKLKKEIVTIGNPDISPIKNVGEYIEPKDWNALISDPEVLLIDTRNQYEVEIGTFKGAINPNTQSFREFPTFVDTKLDRTTHKKVAMFCTGGIRCEKASALMLERGFEKVYHLNGGILNYLENIDKANSLWNGECFVFDERTAVKHGLEQGQYQQCHGCRYPITAQDMTSPHYVKGVSCPHCYNKLTDEQKDRFEQRQLQIELAKQRHEPHLGKVHPHHNKNSSD